MTYLKLLSEANQGNASQFARQDRDFQDFLYRVMVGGAK